ncbi:MAG: multiprotein-bridging factor 1 family protein [Bacilli bacterium]
MNYPKMLKKYREKVLLTQTELAEKLGVSFASVNRWENGLFEPTMKVKRKLRELFKEAGIEEE